MPKKDQLVEKTLWTWVTIINKSLIKVIPASSNCEPSKRSWMAIPNQKQEVWVSSLGCIFSGAVSGATAFMCGLEHGCFQMQLSGNHSLSRLVLSVSSLFLTVGRGTS